MALEVAAWNVKEGLAQAEQAPLIVERIKRMGAAVVALSDAYSLENVLHGSDEETLENSREQLRSEGYEIHEAEYGDPWHHDRNLMMLSRSPFGAAHAMRVGPRRAIRLRTTDMESQQPVDIFGVHFPDTDERSRRWMARHLTERLDSNTPSIVMGDINTMYPDDIVARIARSNLLRTGINHLPEHTEKLKRYKSIASRFTEMATGETLRYLYAHGLSDADPMHERTFPSRRPLAQFDRILVTEAISVNDFSVEPHCDASDHRAIRAQLRIR